MKKGMIWKVAAALLAAAILVVVSVFVFMKPQDTAYAAGDTYQVSDETELAEALDSLSDNDTIILTDSFTLDNMHCLDLSNTVTLDLNGHTLTSAPDYNVIELSGSGKTVTIADSVGGGTVNGDDNTIQEGGTGNELIINAGALNSNNHQSISVTGQKNKLTVNGGEINNGIWVAGTDIQVTVHGGTISSDETAVELSGIVYFNMDGGKINAATLALSIEDELLQSTVNAAVQEQAGEIGDPTTAETTEEPSSEEPTTTSPTPPTPGHNTIATVNISGGTLTSVFDSAIFFPEKGTLTISGGAITGHTAVYLQSGKTTITGGTFIGNGDYVEFADTGDYSGCTATGDALVVEACENETGQAQVDVQGGTFISVNGKPIASYQASDGPAWEDDTAQRLSGFVSGGWFNAKVANEGDVYTQDILAKGLSATDACSVEEGAQDGAPYSVGYKLSFDANGGDPIKDIYIPPLGDKNHGGIMKAFPIPTYANHVFQGWYTSPTGGDEVKAGGPVTMTSDMTLYAHWDVTQYKITYNLDGGKVAQNNPESYTSDTPDFTLTNPTKDGFYFKGWTGTDLKEPTQTVTIKKGSTGDRAYTANWGIPGTVTNGTDAKTNACHAMLDDTIQDLGNVALNAEDVSRVKNGENISISLKAEDVTTTVSEENKNTIAQALDDGGQVSVYMDMDLFKAVGNDQPRVVENPKGNVTITISIPEELWSADGNRSYGIIHLHNGLAQKVDTISDKSKRTLTFKTSSFSIFALTYSDAKAPENPTDNSGSGGTDPEKPIPTLANPMFWLVVGIIIFVSVGIVVMYAIMRKSSEKKKDK